MQLYGQPFWYYQRPESQEYASGTKRNRLRNQELKKRKKRRSKTEGGDKPPFDAEMGKNQKAIKVLQRLFDAGYGTEKEIVNMTMDEMLALPGVNVADLCIISELQKSIKANKVISYLSKKTEAREETKGADYGGTT